MSITGNIQDTRGALGRADTTKNTVLFRNNEFILHEENATIVKTRDTSGDNLWGKTTWGGGLWDGTYTSSPVIVRVVNPNNTFREHFRDTTFKATPATADWDTTNYRLAMSSSTDKTQMYNTIMQSSSIFLNNQTVTAVVVSATEVKFGNDIIRYFVSADGGLNWEECTLNTEKSLTNTGTDLRFRVLFVGNGANQTYITDLTISYTT